MDLKKCEKGHFYDAEKFSTCPHCSSGMSAVEETIPLNLNSNEDKPTEMLTAEKSVSVNVQPQPEIIKTGKVAGEIGHLTGAQVSPIDDQDDVKTVRFDETESGIEPVVGWLVCTEGKEKGKSFSLKSGRNFIGRSNKMDIVLKDETVSREKHAVVIFEPKHRDFLTQNGESSGLFYLNDEVVLTPQKLKAYDALQLGDAKLVFVPFCSETFGWDD